MLRMKLHFIELPGQTIEGETQFLSESEPSLS